MVLGGAGEGGLLKEKDLKIGKCERGIVVTRIPSASLSGSSGKKKKPDRKILSVRRETMLVVWHNKSHVARNRFEGSIDIRDIKEIRGCSNKSRDFDRCTEEVIQSVKPSRCFVILYGKEFNLKTFSCVTISEEECIEFVDGLVYLLSDVASASYKHEQERWFRKGFYQFELPGKEGSLGLPELKKFLHKISYKIPTSLLKEKFTKYDRSSTGEISFDDFCNILQELLLTRDLFKDVFGSYSSDGRRVTLEEFQSFLEKDNRFPVKEDVGAQMRHFLQDTSRDVKDPYFTIYEFMDWLFSKNNRVYQESDLVDQDMSRPLSHYWISSSHNTYLTGDQISSDSSVEAYARCLRMGCRSVELDCWDGPEESPIIYHGHTLTSKIKFLDVIKTIKDNAFVTSEYPVILSIEDHCTLPQQRKMAALFESVFGDSLVSAPLEKNETALPSPEKLKYRIILKHKKLPEGADEVVITKNSIRRADGGIDISSSVKNGILFLQDSETQEWEPNFFILTQNKMYYSEVHSNNQDEEEEDNESTLDEDGDLSAHNLPSTSSSSSQIQDSSELHFGETWFHANIKNGRSTAETLLKSNASLGDGTFLVRSSETFVGDYSLSFLRQGEVFHVPIKSRQQNGKFRFFLIDQNYFDSLFSLINYYKKSPLKSARFSITLNRACPPPNPHESKGWFRKTCTREQAEKYLNGVKAEGAFVVRVGERMQGTFAISFRAENKVKHCLIKPEGRFFSMGSLQFESLVKLVNYYMKNPLYKKVRLKYPIPEEPSSSSELNYSLGQGNGGVPGSQEECPQGYFDPSSLAPRVYVRACYDYQARRDDELSFSVNSVISNVKKAEQGWWVGDLGHLKQHWFPANFVVEIDPPPTASSNSSSFSFTEEGGAAPTQQQHAPGNLDSQAPLGSLQKGVWDITAAKVEVLESANVLNAEGDRLWILQIDIPSPNDRKQYRVGITSEDEATQWKLKIQETGQTASHREDEHRKNERAMRVARELSNLVIYCRSVVFNLESYLRMSERNPSEMSSFPETKAEKLMSAHSNMFLWYHRVQLSRVYPKAQRVDSSNYNPLPLWNMGSQMTALNYQTGDKPMQINVGWFLSNGNCGYVLRPEFMFSPAYVPGDPKSLGRADPLVLGVRVLAARHLTRNKNKNSIISPNVEVEVLGAEYDNFKNRTRSINDNGFNPVWDEFFDFTVQNPQLALIRFTVFDYDIFGENNFIGQYTCPLIGIQTGYRSVPLKNAYSELLELSALLVHITLKDAHGESYELRKLRETAHDLQRRSDMSHECGDELVAESLHLESQRREQRIMKLMGIGR